MPIPLVALMGSAVTIAPWGDLGRYEDARFRTAEVLAVWPLDAAPSVIACNSALRCREPPRLAYGAADQPLIEEMHAMIGAGAARNGTDAARAVAARAAGQSEESSKVTRLAHRYLNTYPGDP